MPFEVIPAIDLKDGKCVRLFQGDFSQETVFSDDPVAMALKWEEQGAPRLHIVDLDGAASGEPKNLPLVEKIVKAVKIPIQLGGGIRTLKTITALRNLGIGRVVLGTVATVNPTLVKEAIKNFPNGIVVGVDCKNGRVAIRGWTQEVFITPLELISNMTKMGVRRFIFTDIAKDGTLTQPSFKAIQELIKETKTSIIASGGVSSVDHLKRLRDLGAEGAIVGIALYTGAMDYRAAVNALSK